MLRFLARRLLVTLLVIACTSVLAFSLVHLSGDPAAAMAGEGASPADVESIRRLYGFDQPIHTQYFAWIGKILAGDFGRSFYLRQSVITVLAEHAPVTAKLGLSALVFALLLSIPLGILAGLHRDTALDRFALGLAVAGQALPSFLFALLLIYIFGVQLRWLPISGSATWLHFVLPSVTLGYYAAPALMRLTRSGMIDVMQSDHVRTARAYGLPAWRVVLLHALRSAIIPVFSLKGLGLLAWQSIQRSDIEVIQAILLLIALIYALLTLLADLLNALIDPRIRIS